MRCIISSIKPARGIKKADFPRAAVRVVRFISRTSRDPRRCKGDKAARASAK